MYLKVTQKFNDCKLYVSGRLILSGVGTIISVTEAEIKLQIVGGKSRIKYNDRMTKHYIDEIQHLAQLTNLVILSTRAGLRDLKTFKRSMTSIDLMKISRSSWE